MANSGFFKTLRKKAPLVIVSLIIGLVLGVGGTIFVLNHNPEDESEFLSASVVFERIVSKNELVTAAQNYSIVDKATDTNRLFDLFDIPFTQNSFWYRYAGTIKAGVDLENADFSQEGSLILITLDQPYIISNTPDMNKTGVLEENNNVLNPIHVEDVDAFQSMCVEKSEAEVLEGSLMEEARENAEQNIRDMFIAALGDGYTIDFDWRNNEE